MEPYRKLITYQLSEEVFDLTAQFCKKFLSEIKYSRTVDQMTQAARSGKQNIVEGYLGKSRKTYIKLLSVARASLGELLEDYYDFSRTRNIKFRENLGKSIRRSSLPFDPLNPLNPEPALSYLINLIRRTTYLLDRQIAALEKKFEEEGGFTENLYKKRVAFRRKSFGY